MNRGMGVLTSVLTPKFIFRSKRVLTPGAAKMQLQERELFRPSVLTFRPVKTKTASERFDPLRKRKGQNTHGLAVGDPRTDGPPPQQSQRPNELRETEKAFMAAAFATASWLGWRFNRRFRPMRSPPKLLELVALHDVRSATVARNVTYGSRSVDVKTQVRRRKKPRLTTTQPGYWAAKRAMQRFGDHVIDGRSRVARALDEFRDDLIRDLGGEEAVSQQQRVIVDLVVRTHLMVQSLDNYLLTLGSLVNRRKRALWPVVRERTALADSLAKHLAMLGLEKKQPPEKKLHEYIAEPVGDEPHEDDSGHDERPEAVPADVSEATVTRG
jgi:hypothetical protein